MQIQSDLLRSGVFRRCVCVGGGGGGGGEGRGGIGVSAFFFQNDFQPWRER